MIEPRIPPRWHYYSIVSYYFRRLVAEYNQRNGTMPTYAEMRFMHRFAVNRTVIYGGAGTPKGEY